MCQGSFHAKMKLNTALNSFYDQRHLSAYLSWKNKDFAASTKEVLHTVLVQQGSSMEIYRYSTKVDTCWNIVECDFLTWRVKRSRIPIFRFIQFRSIWFWKQFDCIKTTSPLNLCKLIHLQYEELLNYYFLKHVSQQFGQSFGTAITAKLSNYCINVKRKWPWLKEVNGASKQYSKWQTKWMRCKTYQSYKF